MNISFDSAVFYTNDLEQVIDFYKKLGLEVEYIQEGRFVSFIFPDGARLGIKLKKEEREIPGAQSVFFNVDNIEALYKQLEDDGATFYRELTVADWGTYFAILDPDKNKVEFVKR